MTMLLVKNNYHTGNNHGALYSVNEEFDEDGKSMGLIASFAGNVVCPNLNEYLAENQDVQVVNCLPEGVSER